MSKAEFARFVLQRLSPHSEALRAQLRTLIDHAYPPEVACLEFEVFADGFVAGFPVRTFFVDGTRTEYFLKGPDGPAYPSPIDPALLGVAPIFTASEEAAFAEREPALDTWTCAAETLVPWFADVWRRAGGATFRLDATIGIHDDPSRLDLRSGAVIPT